MAQNHTISGYVRVASSGEALIGANIYNSFEQNGTATNNYGFYSYSTSRDTVKLVGSYVGFQTKTIKLALDGDLTLNIVLKSGYELEELVVSSEAGKSIEEQTQMSAVTLSPDQIKAVPALAGEVDVLKALQLLPGVKAGHEATSGLYVRGGQRGQNLILLDGVPIYDPSHLAGFVSTFNADAINKVKLMKGGFPARYGGRLSSVADIRLKEGNKKEIKGAGSLGLLSAKIMVNGPVSDNMTFLVSGRRTFLDLLAKPFLTTDSGYNFYDFNGKIAYTPNDDNRFYFSGYVGKDNLNIDDVGDTFGMKWGNIIASFRWNHIYNPKLFSNTTLTYSRYRFNIFTITDTDKIKYVSGIRDAAVSIDFDYFPLPAHHIKFGASVLRHRFTRAYLPLPQLMKTILRSQKKSILPSHLLILRTILR